MAKNTLTVAVDVLIEDANDPETVEEVLDDRVSTQSVNFECTTSAQSSASSRHAAFLFAAPHAAKYSWTEDF
jgi:hypothetical protein